MRKTGSYSRLWFKDALRPRRIEKKEGGGGLNAGGAVSGGNKKDGATGLSRPQVTRCTRKRDVQSQLKLSEERTNPWSPHGKKKRDNALS